jgi:hypothetical protein
MTGKICHANYLLKIPQNNPSETSRGSSTRNENSLSSGNAALLIHGRLRFANLRETSVVAADAQLRALLVLGPCLCAALAFENADRSPCKGV